MIIVCIMFFFGCLEDGDIGCGGFGNDIFDQPIEKFCTILHGEF